MEIEHKQMNVSDTEIYEMNVQLCELGKKMNIEPERFVIIASIAIKALAEAAGMEITSERVLDS